MSPTRLVKQPCQFYFLSMKKTAFAQPRLRHPCRPHGSGVFNSLSHLAWNWRLRMNDLAVEWEKETRMVLVNPHRKIPLLHARCSLAILGRGMQAACRIDPTLRKEVNSIPAGTTITLMIGENGPAMVMYKGAAQLMYLGSGSSGKSTPAGWPSTTTIRIRLCESSLPVQFQESRKKPREGPISIEGVVGARCRFKRISTTPKSTACRELWPRSVKRYQDLRLSAAEIAVYAGMLCDKRGRARHTRVLKRNVVF